MKRSVPDSISLNFGTPEVSPRTSSEFEEISYPHYTTASHQQYPGRGASQRREEELPLHYMGEETARRRVPASRGHGYYDEKQTEYDDDGKDVYAKIRASKMPVGSGRPRRPPTLPATSIVSALYI
jgi:dolichyl-phosphate-mannose-protein mannosyltransferase